MDDLALDRTYEERIAWNALKGIDPPINFQSIDSVDSCNAIKNYVEFEFGPGSCFRAAIIGDLHECYARMHPTLKDNPEILQILAIWFDEQAPELCYGSVEKYNYWVSNGGLFGIEKNGRKVYLKGDYSLTNSYIRV